MKPKGWKTDPRWVMYEENRLARKRYELAVRQKYAAECRLAMERALQSAEQQLEQIHAVH